MPLHLSQLKLKLNGVTSHIDQLLYKGVPNYSKKGTQINGVDYVPVVEREAFTREAYRIFKAGFNSTRKTHFDHLKIYIRWLDDACISPIDGDYFHMDLCHAYMKYHQKNVIEVKKSYLHGQKQKRC